MQNGATTRPENDTFTHSQLINESGFPAAKCGLSLNLKDCCNTYSGSFFQFVVGVDKLQP